MNDHPMIYLCDDDNEVRKSLEYLLRQEGLPVSGHASGPALLAAIDAAPQPLRGVFVLDERMAPMSGSQVHAQLLARGLEHRNPVIFLSGHGTVPVAVTAMSKGAATFMVKPFTAKVFIPKIMEALAQEAMWFARAERALQLAALWGALSPRQVEIAPLVARGDMNKAMAWHLKLSMRMVEEHRRKLQANLRVKSAPELATLLAEMRASGVDLTRPGDGRSDGGSPR
jgi:two-component system response regulator DctR